MVSLVIFLVVFIVLQGVSVLFLWLGARWVKSARATWRRALLAVAMIMVVGIVGVAARGVIPEVRTAAGQWALALTLLIVQLAVIWAVLRGVFATTAGRACILLLLLIGAMGVQLAATVLLVRPYLVHAFLVPTSSMAPAVAGWHKEARCERCGAAVIVPADFISRSAASGPADGICTKCRSVSQYRVPQGRVIGPDRIVVNKLLRPRRWDIVAFYPPHQPDIVYIHRLVGLPGEMVVIDQGAVWIDGRKLDIPPALAGQTYTSDGGIKVEYGDRAHPLRLAADEYFMLGDFSSHAYDSRFYGPVKRQALIGVADLRYWPAGRVGIIR